MAGRDQTGSTRMLTLPPPHVSLLVEASFPSSPATGTHTGVGDRAESAVNGTASGNQREAQFLA